MLSNSLTEPLSCFLLHQGTLNVRINVLFLLDSLCETSLYVGLPDAPYVDYVTRDLAKIVELVVPESREGVLNLLSAKQVSLKRESEEGGERS